MVEFCSTAFAFEPFEADHRTRASPHVGTLKLSGKAQGTSAPKVESRTYHALDLLQPYFSICTLIDGAGLQSFTIILLYGTIGPAIADAATFSSHSSHKLESHNLHRPFGIPAGLPFLLPPSIAAATTNLQGSTDTPIPRPRTAAPIRINACNSPATSLSLGEAPTSGEPRCCF